MLQHDPDAPIPRIPHARAIPRQHICRIADWLVAKQAASGIAAQRTATTSIVNAPFLLQLKAECSRASIVSILCLLLGYSDPNYTQKSQIRPAQPATWLEIERQWNHGGHIEFCFGTSLRTSPFTPEPKP